MSGQPAPHVPEPPLAPQAGEVIAGKYRVENVVGQGGMGIVVAAQHLQLGQSVAIKMLSVGGLDHARRVEATTRFLREGQAAARLTSDHVVRIYDVGMLDSGSPYMVMELLRGDDLSALLEAQGPAPIEVAVDYVIQACDAIAEAHRAGIVHRDLKPSNLFVVRRHDGRVLVKVLDFGISKAVNPDGFDGSLTATRTVVGSPYYMSPEQVRDAKRVDTRTDIWSIGMILYELLVGEPAFHADTLPGICAAIAADQPAPVGIRRGDVPAELEALVMRCLEKDPARRPQTVEELVRLLAPFAPRSAALSIKYGSRELSTRPPVPRASNPVAGTLLDQSGSYPSRREAASLAETSLSEDGHRPSPGDYPRAASSTGGRSSSASSARAGDPGTLVSASPEAPPATGRLRAVVGGALVLALVGAGVAFGMRASATSEPAPAPAPAPAARPFTLRIDSIPSGATVLEGDRVVGTTPAALVVEAASVAGAPRRFTLSLPGYASYPVTQGASAEDVHVIATLSATAPVAPVAAAAPAPAAEAATPEPAAAPRAPSPRPRAPTPRPAPAPAAPRPAPAGDIRLER